MWSNILFLGYIGSLNPASFTYVEFQKIIGLLKEVINGNKLLGSSEQIYRRKKASPTQETETGLEFPICLTKHFDFGVH